MRLFYSKKMRNLFLKTLCCALISLCWSCSDANQVKKDPVRESICGTPNKIQPQLTSRQPVLSVSDETVCGCNEGFLLDYTSGECYGLGYLDCSEYPASVCEQAGCAYENTACITPNHSICVGHTHESDCEDDITGNCSWIGNTTGTGRCEKGTSGCEGMQTQSECDVSNSCTWYPAAKKHTGECISWTAACDALTDDTSCNATKTCYWNNTGYCGAAYASCANYSESSCQASGWCTWDSGSNACVSLVTGSCSQATSSNICGNLKGCIWDDLGNGKGSCLSTHLSTCSSSSSEFACEKIAGCFWNNSTPIHGCQSQLTASCETVKTQPLCEGLYGCYWDASANNCISQITGSCSEATENACENIFGCFWNGSVCGSKTFSNCTDQTTLLGCDKLTGCLWNPDTNQCLSQITSSCSNASVQSTCAMLNLCSWDSGNNTCQSSLSCEGSSQSSCQQSTLCGWSTSQQCISRVWCWWAGDCL